MKKITLLLSLLLLAGLASIPAPRADPAEDLVVEVGAGVTDFAVRGQNFRIQNEQPLRIVFHGVSAGRVHGVISTPAGQPIGYLEFIWKRDFGRSLELGEGLKNLGDYPFDSDDVTGHNEK